MTATPPASFARRSWSFSLSKSLVIGGRVAGGCLGLDRGGMTWQCYIGQDAVDRAIVGQNLLGQPAPYPGRG